MLCDVCKTREATMHMSGTGDFCLDCHNARIAKEHHYDRLELFAREIIVQDASNRPHHFTITNLLMPHFSEWTAEEDNDGYKFSVMAKPEDDQDVALLRLHRKVIIGLQHQTLRLQDSEHRFSNALQTSDGQYSLHETGSGRIEYDRVTDCGHLIIDGRPVSASDFLRMLSTFEGYNLLFQIRALSDDILEKDMILAPLCMDAETILNRFKESLRWFLDGSFLSYKREPACCSALFDRLDEFELLCRHGKPETARAVGQAIIECLLAVENDTDDFPDHLVDIVEQYMPVVSP